MARTQCPFSKEELYRLHVTEKLDVKHIGHLASERIGRDTAFGKSAVYTWLQNYDIPSQGRGCIPPKVDCVRADVVKFDNKCPVCRCKMSVSLVMCYSCWELLPFPSQWTTWQLFLSEGRSSKAFQEALSVSVEIVREVKNG